MCNIDTASGGIILTGTRWQEKIDVTTKQGRRGAIAALQPLPPINEDVGTPLSIPSSLTLEYLNEMYRSWIASLTLGSPPKQTPLTVGGPPKERPMTILSRPKPTKYKSPAYP